MSSSSFSSSSTAPSLPSQFRITPTTIVFASRGSQAYFDVYNDGRERVAIKIRIKKEYHVIEKYRFINGRCFAPIEIWRLVCEFIFKKI
jgi:P pilus assembly chaperone PapD